MQKNIIVKIYRTLSSRRETRISELQFAMLSVWLVVISFHPDSSISRGAANFFLGIPSDTVRFLFLITAISSTLSLFSSSTVVKRWSALLNSAEYLLMTVGLIFINPWTVASGTFMCVATTAFVLFLKLSIQEQEAR